MMAGLSRPRYRRARPGPLLVTASIRIPPWSGCQPWTSTCTHENLTDVITTESFTLGGIVGKRRYLFFALFQDYNDLARGFVQEFNVYLERLARDMGPDGAVVRPFLGDIERTRDDVQSKEWTWEEWGEVERAPSLLVISKDFADFSPRADP